ncbi:DUF2971 domain-containing protein [Paucibacter sp. DJ1R-11]|uniref:DUF2971 domain-containing protein n=1 Tax=Paucibacter sp. DJ1R-11 TaxID=2893556 RepID=UPI0021E4F03B|nr:DUF2971 domain-containing protein [Paucibacter sp. DJ1R-11]MCV2362471.1 DUF2971 domain-containing protein [Paucibacter sp. DJ1R-11]
MTESTSVLRRYTDLASLLDLLQRRAITLLPPSTWDDGNDRLMMSTYKECRGLNTLLALCLTSREETYHHWRVFTDRSNGVCVVFRREAFTRVMTEAGVEVNTMNYLKLDELDIDKYPVLQLPFLKRAAFQDEGEVRAVYGKKALEKGLKRVGISLDLIEVVRLNPWMPKPVADSVRETIQLLRGDANFKVSRSALIDAKGWREFAAKYKNPDFS